MTNKRLRLDFAPRPRRLSGPGLAVLLLCAALLLAALWPVSQMLSSKAGLEASLARLQAQREARARPAARAVATDPAERTRLRALRRVAQNLTTPWADVLESLEAAPNQAVALLSVEPSAAKRSIRITAEARDAQDMLAYLAALQQDTRLTSVVLLSHQVQAQAPGMPLRFQLQAGWGPAP